jgi:hypothetical protein
MSSDLEKAFLAFHAARPKSGFRPETPDEWRALQLALEHMGYVTLRTSGVSEAMSRELSHATYGGRAGLKFIEIAFEEISHE